MKKKYLLLILLSYPISILVAMIVNLVFQQTVFDKLSITYVFISINLYVIVKAITESNKQ